MDVDGLIRGAGRLPKIAGLFAVSGFVPHMDHYPFLQKADPARWDFIVTSACVFLAVTRLHKLNLTEESENLILDATTESVARWHPDGLRAVEACRSMFEREYERLSQGGHPSEYLAADALGIWVFWNLFDRAPSSQAEVEFVRTLGGNIVHEFFRYWS